MSKSYYKGEKEFFPGIGTIKFEGTESDNPLAFKFYNPEKIVAGKSMKDHLKFAVAYWHSFCNEGGDPFGPGTRLFPWGDKDAMKTAINKADACFEFATKIGMSSYCFHDRDAAPEGSNAAESEKNLHTVAEYLKELQDETGIKLLWNTANVFSNPRFMNGAASNPDFGVVAHVASQVKAALDVNVKLGGENYVFWGGREGYMSLWNTNMKREQEHIATFLAMARDYGRKIGFNGIFLIEPKPMEPSKHQYDYDAATSIGFLRANGLADDFKCNIEANHATLAGHSFAHDLQICADAGMLGSIDANIGDPMNGWDTDQFPTNVYDAVEAMMVVLNDGGLKGGLNFDAKLRRNSSDPEDLFIAHIGGMDTFALGLIMADKIISDGKLSAMKKNRYSSFDSGKGKEFEQGEMDLPALAAHANDYDNIGLSSGKQELIENIINQYLFS